MDLFERDRPVHVYGLADLDESYWSSGRWWRAGDAVVGVLRLPGAPTPVVYAVSARAPEATLALLVALAPDLPEHFVVTGPVGLAERLSPPFDPVWSKAYLKMHLAEPGCLPPPSDDVDPLDRSDLADVVALFDRDDEAGDFFQPYLLDTGLYLGRRIDGRLVACAGVHAVSDRFDVAAVGNVATDPDHRRRGHARAVVATLCHRLAGRFGTIGLNVGRENAAARALYESLGFTPLVPYEEAELARRSGSDPVT